MYHTNESAENYLETILLLSKTRPVVRSVDIAEELGFKKSPSKRTDYCYKRRLYLSDRFWKRNCGNDI